MWGSCAFPLLGSDVSPPLEGHQRDETRQASRRTDELYLECFGLLWLYMHLKIETVNSLLYHTLVYLLSAKSSFSFLCSVLNRCFPPFLLLNVLSSKGCFVMILDVRSCTSEDILQFHCSPLATVINLFKDKIIPIHDN